VTPDVDVFSDDALAEAELRILDGLIRGATDTVHLRALRWAREAIQVRRSPNTLPPGQMEDYLGEFGTRTVRIEEGALVYQRGSRPPRRMVPLGADTFLLEGVDGFRSRFERDPAGNVLRMIDMWSEGHEESSPRHQPF